MELYLLCQHETGRELVIRFDEGRLPSVPYRYHAYAVLTEVPKYDKYGNAILPSRESHDDEIRVEVKMKDTVDVQKIAEQLGKQLEERPRRDW